MADVKYDLVKGFCEKLGYNGLWAVKYEGFTGNFRKVSMSCSCADVECATTCKVIKDAREVIPYDEEWLLMDSI